MYGVTPPFGGAKVVFKFNKFTLDQGKFKRALVHKLTEKVKLAGRSAFDLSYERIPVWSGESRGGLNALINQLGGHSIQVTPHPNARKRPRRNRWTKQLKSPTSAITYTSGPTVTFGNRILFTYTTTAEGFVFGDKKEIPKNPRTPFKFSATFMRHWRQMLAHEMKKDPEISLRSFSGTQRTTYYVE